VRTQIGVKSSAGEPSCRMMSRVALLLLCVAVGAMSALHVYQPGLSVIHQPLSFYVHGRHGWLLPVSLGAFAVAAAALGASVRCQRSSTKLRWWLVGFGAGMLIDAAVPSDRWFPWEGVYSPGGALHAFCAVVAPPLLFGAMLSWAKEMSATGRGGGRGLNALAVTYLFALGASGLSLSVGFARDVAPPFIGLAERVLALAAVGWLALVASASRLPPASGR
jgi:hypothetical protein